MCIHLGAFLGRMFAPDKRLQAIEPVSPLCLAVIVLMWLSLEQIGVMGSTKALAAVCAGRT
jgi:hypothetical protein